MMCFFKSLLVVMLIAFPLANTISDGDIENLCKETADNIFCLNIFKMDPNVQVADDLNGVLDVTIKKLRGQVGDATKHLGSVRGKYNGPNGKKRIEKCSINYGIAMDSFLTAWKNSKSYGDVDRLTRIGTDAVMECEYGWSRDGPAQKSPLTYYNMNVSKMYGIISLLVRKLGKV